jgi:hypothetical protein
MTPRAALEGRSWQLRTWTKGTGAAVEPVGASDSAPLRARPGGLVQLPAKAAWAQRRRADAPAGRHCTADAATRRLAARHLSEQTIDALLELRERLEAGDAEGLAMWRRRK